MKRPAPSSSDSAARCFPNQIYPATDSYPRREFTLARFVQQRKTAIRSAGKISRHLAFVDEVDKKLLPVADSIPQLPGFRGALSRRHRLPNNAIGQAQIRICHRELGIDF